MNSLVFLNFVPTVKRSNSLQAYCAKRVTSESAHRNRIWTVTRTPTFNLGIVGQVLEPNAGLPKHRGLAHHVKTLTMVNDHC